MNDEQGMRTRFGYDTTGSPMVRPYVNQPTPIAASKANETTDTP